MSRRILVILLVVSLMFNAAVLIGFVRARTTGGVSTSNPTSMPATAPEEKSLIARLARELGLDESQSGALEGLRRRQMQQSSVFGDSVLVVRQDLQQELRKEQPDLERVRTLVDQEADLVRQRRQAEAELYGEFVTMLTPDQRQRLGRRVGATPPPSGPEGPEPRGRDGQPRQPRGGQPQQPPPPEIVRRFDHNNNGRLDGDEMRVARKELEARRREVAPHVQQRPPLWPWFDADDDGELNEIEKAEMDEFMRTHHAPPPPPSTEPDGRNGRDRRPDPNRPERGDRRGPPIGPGPDGPNPGNPGPRPPIDGPPPPQQRPAADSPPI